MGFERSESLHTCFLKTPSFNSQQFQDSLLRVTHQIREAEKVEPALHTARLARQETAD